MVTDDAWPHVYRFYYFSADTLSLLTGCMVTGADTALNHHHHYSHKHLIFVFCFFVGCINGVGMIFFKVPSSDTPCSVIDLTGDIAK